MHRREPPWDWEGYSRTSICLSAPCFIHKVRQRERDRKRRLWKRERVSLSFSLTHASCCSAVHRGQILIHFLSVVHLNLQSSLVCLEGHNEASQTPAYWSDPLINSAGKRKRTAWQIALKESHFISLAVNEPLVCSEHFLWHHRDRDFTIFLRQFPILVCSSRSLNNQCWEVAN